jgi:hypothetical protein
MLIVYVMIFAGLLFVVQARVASAGPPERHDQPESLGYRDE